MALSKEALKQSIDKGFNQIFKAQAAKATSGDENEDPNKVIDDMTAKMADVVADAIEAYVKSGDIIITQANIVVTSPTGPCTVAPAQPAKVV